MCGCVARLMYVLCCRSYPHTSLNRHRSWIVCGREHSTAGCIFIAEYPVAVDRARRRNQTSEAADAVDHVYRGRSWSPMFWVIAWAFHLSRDAEDFCGSSGSFSFGIVGDRTHTRIACRIARACPESVASTSNNMRMFVDSTGIPGAHWCRPMMERAFAGEYYCVVMSWMMSARWHHFENLKEVTRKKLEGKKREKKFD